MYGGLRDDISIQAVAQVDGVDVVTAIRTLSAWFRRARARSRDNIPLQITVHDGEEDLKEQVDGVYEHRQQV